MESTERLPPASSRRAPGRGTATTRAGVRAPVQLLFLLLLCQVASPATNGPTVALAQVSTEVEQTLSSSEEGSACNTTLYREWYDLPYSLTGALLVDLVDFWIFPDAELTNGQALEVVSSSCRVMMDTLRLDRAGRNGPVADKYIYDVMCANECTLSDEIRQEAMELSSCTCLQLSTQPSDPTYHTPGDWILCETFGQCGKWDCRLSDFMCPRYEYNKHEVLHRGKGDCSGAGGGRKRLLWENAATTATTLLACSAVAALQWYRR